MKTTSKPRTLPTLLVALVCLVPASCDDADVRAGETVESARNEVQDELDEALRALEQRIEALDDELPEAGRAARAELAEVLAELREREAALERDFAELRAAGADSWDEVRRETVDSVRALQRSVDEAWERFASGH